MAKDMIAQHAGEDEATEIALGHIRKAELDLAHAREGEIRAEHELERAVEELVNVQHDEGFWVIVNGRRKEVLEHNLTFEQVVALAFSAPPQGPGVQFTVQYTRGPERKPTGTLIEGQSVKVKNGIEFDVTSTNRS